MRIRLLIFFSILFVLLLYTGMKAAAFFPQRRPAGWALAFLYFFIMIGWNFSYRGGWFPADSLVFKGWMWAGSTMLGLWATFVLLSLPLDAVRVAGVLGMKIARMDPFPAWWEPLFSRGIPGVLLLASVAMTALGLKTATEPPRVKEVAIAVRGIPTEFESLRVVQIGDTHIGPTIRRKTIEKIVEQVNALEPDVIVFTGDTADGYVSDLSADVAPFAHLKARLGKFFITGNHEYYWDAKAWVGKMTELGFVSLINENRLIDVHGKKLGMAGITDEAALHFVPEHRPDMERASVGLEDARLKILLAHRPVAEEAQQRGFDLLLAGHTHGGQFFPFTVPVAMTERYYRGLTSLGSLWIYVHPGTGYWGPPNRFGVPAEIAVIRFKSGGKT